jgi:small subunit ribosomal protein S3
MASERKFVVEAVRRVLLREYMMEQTKRAGFGGLDIQRTPMGTRVTLLTERPGLVIGRKGGAIKQLTDDIEHKFKFDNPQIEVQEVENPSLNAQIMSEKLASALEMGWHFRRAGHSTVRRIMEAGAKGCLIVISGKLTGQRHRTEKFKEGHIKFCGETKIRWMDIGFAVAKLKPGVLGVKVQIMKKEAKLPDEISVKERVVSDADLAVAQKETEPQPAEGEAKPGPTEGEPKAGAPKVPEGEVKEAAKPDHAKAHKPRPSKPRAEKPAGEDAEKLAAEKRSERPAHPGVDAPKAGAAERPASEKKVEKPALPSTEKPRTEVAVKPATESKIDQLKGDGAEGSAKVVAEKPTSEKKAEAPPVKAAEKPSAERKEEAAPAKAADRPHAETVMDGATPPSPEKPGEEKAVEKPAPEKKAEKPAAENGEGK